MKCGFQMNYKSNRKTWVKFDIIITSYLESDVNDFINKSYLMDHVN